VSSSGPKNLTARSGERHPTKVVMGTTWRWHGPGTMSVGVVREYERGVHKWTWWRGYMQARG
jgi:hypothetical protein